MIFAFQALAADGSVKVLKDKTPLKAGEILDATRMSKRALVAFYAQRKFYPALVKALSAFEAEAAAYEAPEYGDLESDYDTY